MEIYKGLLTLGPSSYAEDKQWSKLKVSPSVDTEHEPPTPSPTKNFTVTYSGLKNMFHWSSDIHTHTKISFRWSVIHFYVIDMSRLRVDKVMVHSSGTLVGGSSW